MTCYNMKIEEMAEAGISEEEIRALESEVRLARERAKIEAYQLGMTKDQQTKMMLGAERETRKRIHDEWHAKLDSMMDEIRQLAGAAKKLPQH